MNTTENILKSHGLKLTKIRKDILDLFRNSKIALGQADIEDQLVDFDRITIYRTLKKFESSGLVHKVLNDSNIIKYAVCSDNCTHEKHQDGHVHFECMICGQTECLDAVDMPRIATPKGYFQESLEVLMKGKCINCK